MHVYLYILGSFVHAADGYALIIAMMQFFRRERNEFLVGLENYFIRPTTREWRPPCPPPYPLS